MDHWWGLRVSLYLRDEDEALRDEIKHMLDMQLPLCVRRLSTHMHVDDVATGPGRCA